MATWLLLLGCLQECIEFLRASQQSSYNPCVQNVSACQSTTRIQSKYHIAAGVQIWGQGSLPPGTEAAADHPPGLKRSESSASPEGKSAASLRRSTSTAVSPDARGTAGKPPENAVLNNGQVSDAEGPLSPSPKKAEAE